MGRPKKQEAATAKVDARVTPAERAALDQVLAELRKRGVKAGDSTSEWIRSHLEADCAAFGIRIDRPLSSQPGLPFARATDAPEPAEPDEHTSARALDNTTPRDGATSSTEAQPARPSEPAPAATMDVAPPAPTAPNDTGELRALIVDLSARLSALEARSVAPPIAAEVAPPSLPLPAVLAPEPAADTAQLDTAQLDTAPDAHNDVEHDQEAAPAADVAPSPEHDGAIEASEPAPASKPAQLDTAHEKQTRTKQAKPKASSKTSTTSKASTSKASTSKASTSKASTSKASTKTSAADSAQLTARATPKASSKTSTTPKASTKSTTKTSATDGAHLDTTHEKPIATTPKASTKAPAKPKGTKKGAT